jgi:hypothetical protein
MENKPSIHGSAPNAFITKHRSDIIGVLSGFDRLRLSGTLRALYYPPVMEEYLNKAGVLFKHFKAFVLQITAQIKAATLGIAQKSARPLIYLSSSAVRKEEMARRIAQKDGIEDGLIAVLSCVEPCRTYTVGGNPQTKHLELRLDWGKCLHYYFYHQHPEFGLMHLRLQTWFPFLINVCLNGRQWLARQMAKAGIEFEQKDNCFTWIKDWDKAQALADQQLQTRWPETLERLVKDNHPTHRKICQPLSVGYYWSACESEYATDVAFCAAQRLAKLYPSFVHHGIKSFGSVDVLRFLGYKPPQNGVGRFLGQVTSSLKKRPEGLRLKHFAKGNSIKLYDKQGSVLRVETTINHPDEFKVYRARENRPKDKKEWCELRRSLADLGRRAQVSQAANDRYLTALSVVDEKTPLAQEAVSICQPVRKDGQRYRALNPWSAKDARLLELINRGEFAINGFRNRDLRAMLHPKKATQEEEKRRTGRITRHLRLLRAHGLIHKVPGTHRYVVSPKGRKLITALMTARQADVDALTKLAA